MIEGVHYEVNVVVRTIVDEMEVHVQEYLHDDNEFRLMEWADEQANVLALAYREDV